MLEYANMFPQKSQPRDLIQLIYISVYNELPINIIESLYNLYDHTSHQCE